MDVTKSSVALAWSRPKDDGGSAITGYFIEYKVVSDETWSRHQTKISSTMFTLPGLQKFIHIAFFSYTWSRDGGIKSQTGSEI